jgi:hypothetical protein
MRERAIALPGQLIISVPGPQLRSRWILGGTAAANFLLNDNESLKSTESSCTHIRQ